MIDLVERRPALITMAVAVAVAAGVLVHYFYTQVNREQTAITSSRKNGHEASETAIEKVVACRELDTMMVEFEKKKVSRDVVEKQLHECRETVYRMYRGFWGRRPSGTPADHFDSGWDDAVASKILHLKVYCYYLGCCDESPESICSASWDRYLYNL